MDEQLTGNFLPLENAVLEQNALVLNTGDRLVLFDTGIGSLSIFGQTTGKLIASLKQAGIDGKDIDAVVMSHAHIDHCGGNAWPTTARATSPTRSTTSPRPTTTSGPTRPRCRRTIQGRSGAAAEKNLKPNRDRMVFFKDGQEFLPGITAIGAPGHTVGHTVFKISSGGKRSATSAI